MDRSEIHSRTQLQTKRVHTKMLVVEHLLEPLEPLPHVVDILDLIFREH